MAKTLSILEALSQQKPDTAPDGSERGYCEDGQLTMHGNIFELMMKELGIAPDIIADVMLEPDESRDYWVEYFRGISDNR